MKLYEVTIKKGNPENKQTVLVLNKTAYGAAQKVIRDKHIDKGEISSVRIKELDYKEQQK